MVFLETMVWDRILLSEVLNRQLEVPLGYRKESHSFQIIISMMSEKNVSI